MQLAQQEAKLFIREKAYHFKKIGIIQFENRTEIILDLDGENIKWVCVGEDSEGTNQDILGYLKNKGFNFAFWKRIMITEGVVGTNGFDQLYLSKGLLYFLN